MDIMSPRIVSRGASLGVVLLLGTLLLFLRTTENKFVNLDDSAYVLENPEVQAGLTIHTCRYAMSAFVNQMWSPLTLISIALDFQLFGLHPGGYHLTNVILHAINTMLLFVFFNKTTGRSWTAVLAAAIFSWHPLRVESVAWISERKDVLSGFFFFLCLLAYERYARRPNLFRYGVVAACCFLGMLAKPMIATLPGVLLLLDFWPLRRFQFNRGQRSNANQCQWASGSVVQLLAEKLPLLLLCAVTTFVSIVAAREYSGPGSISYCVLNSAIFYVRYLLKIICPGYLSVVYPWFYWLPENLITALIVLVTASAVSALVLRPENVPAR